MFYLSKGFNVRWASLDFQFIRRREQGNKIGISVLSSFPIIAPETEQHEVKAKMLKLICCVVYRFGYGHRKAIKAERERKRNKN